MDPLNFHANTVFARDVTSTGVRKIAPGSVLGAEWLCLQGLTLQTANTGKSLGIYIYTKLRKKDVSVNYGSF